MKEKPNHHGLNILIYISLICLVNLVATGQAGSALINNEADSDISGVAAPSDSIKLDLAVIGTVLLSDGKDMTMIVNRKTGGIALYQRGETVDGAEIIRINAGSVEFEKNGQVIAVNLQRNVWTGPFVNNTPSASSATVRSVGRSQAEQGSGNGGFFANAAAGRGLPYIEPVAGGAGTRVNDDLAKVELPYFEPLTNTIGPETRNDVPQAELPYFEPLINDTGPVTDDNSGGKELPDFTPVESSIGPARNSN